MKRFIVLLILLICCNAYAGPPSRIKTYETGTTILASDVSANEDAIFNYLQAGVDTFSSGSIVDADIATSASIDDSKIDLSAVAQATEFVGAVTFNNISDLGAVSTTGAITLGGKLTAGANEIEGSNFDINGGTIDEVTLDGANVDSASLTGMLFVNDSSDNLSQLGSQGTTGQWLQSANPGNNPTWAGYNTEGGAEAINDVTVSIATKDVWVDVTGLSVSVTTTETTDGIYSTNFYSTEASGTPTLEYKLIRGATVIDSVTGITDNGFHALADKDAALAAGTYTIKLQVRNTNATDNAIVSGSINVVMVGG